MIFGGQVGRMRSKKKKKIQRLLISATEAVWTKRPGWLMISWSFHRDSNHQKIWGPLAFYSSRKAKDHKGIQSHITETVQSRELQRLVLVGVFIIMFSISSQLTFIFFRGVGLPPTRVCFPSFPSPRKNRGLSKLKPDFFVHGVSMLDGFAQLQGSRS